MAFNPTIAQGLADEKRATGLEPSIVAYIGDEVTAKALRAGLVELGRTLEVRQGTIDTAIKFYLKSKPPQMLIVDLGEEEDAQAALDRLASVCPPDIRVFAIGTKRDIGFYRHLVLDLGVTEYLAKPVTRDAVQRLLLPILVDQPVTPVPVTHGGHMVAVCGARGGVGTSSIALNLAYGLSEAAGGHVALIDLHLQNGEISLMLGQQPTSELRLALEDETRVDAGLLDRIAIELEPGLDLYASQGEWDCHGIVSAAALKRLTDLMRSKYNFIVVDVPMPLPPAMEPLMSVCRQVVTVLTPDIASLRDTRRIREAVSGIAGCDRVITLLNRADMKGRIDRALIAQSLGTDPDMSIPELGGGMLEAINTGVPAIKAVPALRRHLAPLIREIGGVEAAAAEHRAAPRSSVTPTVSPFGRQREPAPGGLKRLFTGFLRPGVSR